MNIVVLERKRQIRADGDNGGSVQLPPEAFAWFSWKGGDPCHWVANLEEKELTLRLGPPPPAAPPDAPATSPESPS